MHMGVSKGEEGGRWSPPNGWRSLVLGERGPCRIWRSGGFPNFPGKSSPSSPFFLLFTPFSPPRPLFQFLHPSKPSLHLSRSGCIAFSTLPTIFFFFRFLPFPPQPFLKPLSDPHRTPSESLYRVSKRPQKAQNNPF